MGSNLELISQLAEASRPNGTVRGDYLILVELRTMPHGHPDYRFIAQEMWRGIQKR